MSLKNIYIYMHSWILFVFTTFNLCKHFHTFNKTPHPPLYTTDQKGRKKHHCWMPSEISSTATLEISIVGSPRRTDNRILINDLIFVRKVFLPSLFLLYLTNSLKSIFSNAKFPCLMEASCTISVIQYTWKWYFLHWET